MRLRLVAAAVVLLLPAACEAVPAARPPATRPASRPATTSMEPTAGPTRPEAPTTGPTGSIDLPKDAPQTFSTDVDAANLPLRAVVPPGGDVAASWTGSALDGNEGTPIVVLSWSRGDPASPEAGLEVWERSDSPDAPPWRVAFAFTDPAGAGVYGVRFEVGDLTSDGSPDVLSFEDIGGSGACGTWRVIELSVGNYAERYRRQTCDTEVRIANGDLRVRSAVFAPDDAHCCPSADRMTTLRWNGSGWDVIERTTQPT